MQSILGTELEIVLTSQGQRYISLWMWCRERESLIYNRPSFQINVAIHRGRQLSTTFDQISVKQTLNRARSSNHRCLSLHRGHQWSSRLGEMTPYFSHTLSLLRPVRANTQNEESDSWVIPNLDTNHLFGVGSSGNLVILEIGRS